jgi:hypothetical protein
VFHAIRAFVAMHLGPAGAAAHLVLALPDFGLSLLDQLTLLGKEVRSIKQTAIWRERYQPVIGVVMGLEISGGEALGGHPHAHLFVFSHESEELELFLARLSERWRRRLGKELVAGCEVFHLSSDPDEWAPRLRYVMKGSTLDPDWPVELVREVGLALSARKRLLTFWGSARRQGGWLRRRSRQRKSTPRLRTAPPLKDAG